ncbi:MAG TPA: TonB-dependent receptor [Candidatus Acidoferrales bacterium]|nr:TonB-dependent receptor [Candidatus Acidoferrales bacterium]
MLRTTAFRRHAAASLLTTGLLFTFLSFPNCANAQTAGSGTITGTVTDPSGAVVPGADLTIRNTDTGIERKTQSSEAGIYNAAFLPPGHYEVQAAKTGFASVLHKDLTLQVGQTLMINLSMAVQAAQQEVTVTGESPVVDAEKTEVSQVVSDAAVSNLPIAGRRWDSFVLLTPNVTTDGTSGLVSYRGISGLYNSNTVDGANNNQALFSEARGRAISGAYVYSMDSIKEYQVSASNYSAELGQAAGGVVNAVTKSGTNDYHGDLFYYLRYPTWNALDPLPKSQGNYSQPIHQWQQFGGSFGGPIVKDKLFFFLTYDGSRKVNPITYTSTTYNASVRALPCPSQVTATQCANANAFLFGLTGTYPRATNQDVAFGKLDYLVTPRNHLSSSFDFMNYRAPNAYSTAPSVNNSSLSTNGSYVFHERIFVANWDSTVSSSMVNNVRFQWGRDLEVAGSNAPAPYVSISNITAFGENYALPRTAEPDEHRIQFSDTLSKVYGRHTFKTGLDFNFIHEVMINLFNGPSQYSYAGAAQTAFNNWVLDAYGINIGDGLTGKHYSTFVQVTDPVTHVGKDDFYNNDYAGFFEDTFKATSKLTLNMGIRYDVSTIPAPPQPNTLTPLTTLYTSTINIPKNQFAPRVGVAWQVTPNTVIRTGYGLFFAKTTNTTYYATRVENGVYQQTFNCTPTPSASTYCPALTYPNLIFTPPGPALAAPFSGALTPQVTPFTPPAATQSTRGQTPDWVNPRVHEGNVTVERQLPGGFGASAAYVVSRGLRLPIFVDANLAPSTTTRSYDILNASGALAQTYTVPFYTNRIDTNTGQIFVGYSDVNSWYNSMVLTFRHPMRHGLEFTINYTLSKAFDGAQIAGSGGTFNGSDIPLDPKNRKAEYALSDLDQRHRFVANAVYMPSFKGLSNKTAKLILDGWALSTIVTMSTGQPVTPFISGTPSPLDGGLTAGEASNANPTAGRAGWLPRNGYTAPGFHNVDFRLGRQFSFTERLKFSILGEAFNLFNHTNVSSVNTTAFTYTAAGSGVCSGHTNGCLVPSPTFLAPTATSNLIWGPRQLQISARLMF